MRKSRKAAYRFAVRFFQTRLVHEHHQILINANELIGEVGNQYPSMKASALSREKIKKSKNARMSARRKRTRLPSDGGGAGKGARRAFILTLDSSSRPRKSQRERRETKFSEASFPRDSVFFWLGSPRKVGNAAQAFRARTVTIVPFLNASLRTDQRLACNHSGELSSTQTSIRSKLQP